MKPPYQQSCRINQNLLRPMKFIGSPMVKKKSWFNILKRRRKWIFGGLKIKRLSLLTAPSSLNERSLGEAEEELIKNALTVAHAATAAAEEAITTALVDAEIVYLPLAVYLVSLKKQIDQSIVTCSADGGGAAIIAQNIEEKSLDIYSFQRLASDLINLLLEFQNVEATYCVLQHDDH
ncbi:hypothetical protein CMV_025414 [Castanea mollissima]|uniref:Uncharacterized protein n=1 Tax=Castanea mollissima TaxID=60419 RepID=A0A8J4VBH1_9ROSI|nr:hypothetical protein CMV_025414 [Castanea mollissima]